jgi:hypothetical protein
MRPAIRPGDTIQIEPLCPAGLQRGDIALYQRGARFIVHRIVGTWGPPDAMMFLLRGDNSRFPDLPIESTALLGRVHCVERRWPGTIGRLVREGGWLARAFAAALRALRSGSRPDMDGKI